MNDRSIELAFDGKKQKSRSVRTGIPQGSPILPILFLIYIRFLFPKLKLDMNINSSSFIDDISISTSSKSVEINCQRLTKSMKIAFEFVKKNAIQFDDSKSELIHFESKREMSTNSITLSNNIILRSQKLVE